VIGNESVFSASVRFLQRRRETGIQWLLQVYVVDSRFACLDTLDQLDQVRILYFQRKTDQRSGLAGIEPSVMSNRARRLREALPANSS